MHRTRLHTPIFSFAIVLLAAGAVASPIAFETGTYILGNHPDGNAAEPFYGMRLDNLHGAGTFTFDFECGDCGVWMVYDGTSIEISGIAYGGHPEDDAHIDDAYDGLYAIDMHYDLVEAVEDDGDGLQDIGVVAANQMNAYGTLEFLDGTGSWALTDKAGSNPFSLRVGDEDDDDGHRGFDGISGWGWLLFAPIPSAPTLSTGAAPDFSDPAGSQDFLFTARRVPVPATSALLLLGLAALRSRRRG